MTRHLEFTTPSMPCRPWRAPDWRSRLINTRLQRFEIRRLFLFPSLPAPLLAGLGD